MAITYDPAKRGKTLQERDLDFDHAAAVFAGLNFTAEDIRQNYGEIRLITFGKLNGRIVVVVWTPRGSDRHVISMRKANEREQKQYGHLLD